MKKILVIEDETWKELERMGRCGSVGSFVLGILEGCELKDVVEFDATVGYNGVILGLWLSEELPESGFKEGDPLRVYVVKKKAEDEPS